MEDISLKSILNSEELLNVLKLRFVSNKPYTLIGDICLSVNPFQWLDIYENNDSQKAPVFKITRKVLNNLPLNSQTMVISGDSGSGKTELVKICMKYFAKMNKENNSEVHKILQSGPILEFLGNAETCKNENSSRFGKFLELLYENNVQKGAKIKTFLLEKCRVVSHKKPEEGNFHIIEFLAKHKNTQITNQKTKMDIKYEKFTEIGLNEKDITIIFNTATFIIDVSEIINHTQLNFEKIQTIMGLNDYTCITNEKRYIPTGEQINIENTLEKQKTILKTICTTLYMEMFNFVVNRLNDMFSNSHTEKCIGMLDIFGFENFEKNCFEQFCINFANEKIQEQFILFATEFKKIEYMQEDIPFVESDYSLNKDAILTCSFIISKIEEACRLNFAPNILIQNIKNENKSNCLSFPNIKAQKEIFCIQHFAEKTQYEINEFCTKSIDGLNNNLIEKLQHSTKTFIHTLFSNVQKSQRSVIMHNTLLNTFKQNLYDLCTHMGKTEQHFVRCFKPNTIKCCTTFDEKCMKEQLHCSGVIQICEVLRKNHPIRVHKKIFQKYLKFLNEDICIGKTKLFLTEYQYKQLEEIKYAILIQSFVRRYLIIKQKHVKLHKSVYIQSYFRMIVQKQEFQNIKSKASFLQMKIKQYNLQKKKNKLTEMSIVDNLKMQIIILKSELEQQDIWLLKARRLLYMYQNTANDSFLIKKHRQIMT